VTGKGAQTFKASLNNQAANVPVSRPDAVLVSIDEWQIDR